MAAPITSEQVKLDAEDLFADSLELLGAENVPNDLDVVHFGPMALRVAPKEGNATSLLADQLFSPALFLAEHIQLGRFDLNGRAVLELGSGAGLPSILTKTRTGARIVVASDYPDDIILGPLRQNIAAYAPEVLVEGFAWGTDPSGLLKHAADGFDTVILSDLLHFDSSHNELLSSAVAVLKKRSPQSPEPTLLVCCGDYTRPDVCASFVANAASRGIELIEQPRENTWNSAAEWYLRSRSLDDMGLRKAQCRFWIGRWAV